MPFCLRAWSETGARAPDTCNLEFSFLPATTFLQHPGTTWLFSLTRLDFHTPRCCRKLYTADIFKEQTRLTLSPETERWRVKWVGDGGEGRYHTENQHLISERTGILPGLGTTVGDGK